MTTTYIGKWNRNGLPAAGRLLFGLAVVVLLGGTFAAYAGEPCCSITAIDRKTGTVTAKEIAGRRTFQFQVADNALLRRLRVGQKISADLKAMTVTLPAVKPQVGVVRMRVRSTDAIGPRGFLTRASKYTGMPGGDGPSRTECTSKGGEWRCTTIATGSDPGTGDDTISCHCITH